MKTILITISILLASLARGQHLGNFNNQTAEMQISRANIAEAASADHASNKLPITALNPNQFITHTVRSLYNIEATDYTAVFNINQIGATANETTQLINSRMSSVKETLDKQGFQGNFATDMISFLPVYEIETTKKLFSTTYTEVPVGFELQQNFLISYRNDEDFQKILQACAEAEIFNLVKVDYYVENLQDKYNELQEKMLAEISKKKEYYKALGIIIANYEIQMADAKYYHMPKDFYKSYLSSENISTQALKQKKGLTEVRKPVSYYYDAISYNGYDIVINPAIRKPVIQLGMDLVLRYLPKVQKKETPSVPKPKTYIISPQGPIGIQQLPDA